MSAVEHSKVDPPTLKSWRSKPPKQPPAERECQESSTPTLSAGYKGGESATYLAVLAVATVGHTASRYGVRPPQSESADEVVRVDTGSTQSAFKTKDGKTKAGHLDRFRRHVSGA